MIPRGGKASVRDLLSAKCGFNVFDGGLGAVEYPVDPIAQVSGRVAGNLVDCYLNQQIGIQLNCDAGCGGGTLELEGDKFCFVFEKVGVQVLNRGYFTRGSDAELQLPGHRDCCDEMKLPVPVLSRAVVQKLERTNKCLVGHFVNVVRLYRFKPDPQLIREWRLVDGVSFEMIESGTDRKLYSVFVGGTTEAARQYGSLIDGGVERGSQLIKHLSQLKSEVIFGMRRADSPSDARCPIAIHFYDGFPGFWIDKLFPLNIESVRVLLGAVESLPTVV
jgi:hypothetical protein